VCKRNPFGIIYEDAMVVGATVGDTACHRFKLRG